MALAVNGINMAAEAARQTMTVVRMLNPLWTTTMVLLGAKNPWCSPLVMLVTSSSCCDVSIARDFLSLAGLGVSCLDLQQSRDQRL